MQQLIPVKVKRCIDVSSRMEEVIVAVAIASDVLKGRSVYIHLKRICIERKRERERERTLHVDLALFNASPIDLKIPVFF